MINLKEAPWRMFEKQGPHAKRKLASHMAPPAAGSSIYSVLTYLYMYVITLRIVLPSQRSKAKSHVSSPHSEP